MIQERFPFIGRETNGRSHWVVYKFCLKHVCVGQNVLLCTFVRKVELLVQLGSTQDLRNFRLKCTIHPLSLVRFDFVP